MHQYIYYETDKRLMNGIHVNVKDIAYAASNTRHTYIPKRYLKMLEGVGNIPA